LAHVELLGFGTGFAAADDIAPQVHWTGFPNVFSPRWKEHCRKEARRLCLRVPGAVAAWFATRREAIAGIAWQPA
jgi:hypothetical protein